MSSSINESSNKTEMVKKSEIWTRPEVIDLGDVVDLVRGIGGSGGKEPGGNDNQFAPLEIS